MTTIAGDRGVVQRRCIINAEQASERLAQDPHPRRGKERTVTMKAKYLALLAALFRHVLRFKQLMPCD